MIKDAKKSKIKLDKLAQMTQKEFLILDKKIDGVRENMATKDDLKHFATKDDLQGTEVRILQAVDEVVTKFDAAEKEHAAHTSLHRRITDELHGHDQRIKKLEAKV